jgi:isocitrate dehydrogenase kinase/phosphatase
VKAFLIEIPVSKGLVQWLIGVIPATRKAEIGRILVKAARAKSWQAPSQQIIWVHACDSCFLGSTGMMTSVQTSLGINGKTLSEKKLKAKGLQTWLKW